MNRHIGIVILALIAALGIGHRNARAQVQPWVPLTIVTNPGFDPLAKYDPSQWEIVGHVSAVPGSETWEWSTQEPTVWLVAKDRAATHAIDKRVTTREVDDRADSEGCDTLPAAPNDATTWEVYNVFPGDVPRRVGIRYVAKDGFEAWYVSDDYVYAGDGDTAVIVQRRSGAERDPGWTHYIGVR